MVVTGTPTAKKNQNKNDKHHLLIYLIIGTKLSYKKSSDAIIYHMNYLFTKKN
jgi:hypothetical protein